MIFPSLMVVRYYTFHPILPYYYFDETSDSFVQALGALRCFIYHNNLGLYSSLQCMTYTWCSWSNGFTIIFLWATANISWADFMLQEYKYISRKRLAHITGSPPNPGHFTVLVRSIPKSENELLDDTIRHFFVNYHGSSYLSHQMILRKGHFQRFVVSIHFSHKYNIILFRKKWPKCHIFKNVEDTSKLVKYVTSVPSLLFSLLLDVNKTVKLILVYIHAIYLFSLRFRLLLDVKKPVELLLVCIYAIYLCISSAT